MNLHAFATSRRVIAAAAAMIGVGLAGSSASALGIKTVGTVVYAQAPAPGYYTAAPGAYGQAPYYLVTNHHKQYIVPAAAFAPQAYAPPAYAPQAYAPQAYAPQAYAPQAYAPVASAPVSYGYQATATASAPVAAAPVATVAAAPIAAAPEDGDGDGDGDGGTSTSPGADFKLTGALLQTYKDDLRKFYEASTETGGMAKAKALKDEAKNIYSTYYDSDEDSSSTTVNERINQIVDEIVKRDRNRLMKSGSKGKHRWVYTAYGWQLIQSANTDDDDDNAQFQVVAPPAAPIAAPAPYYQAPPQQLYYIPSHRSKFSIR